MADRGGPSVYSIAAHRGFADALVAGLVPRYWEGEWGLARLTLLLPSSRAARTVAEAFIRHAGETGQSGLLMPRMVLVGDLDLDESLGAMLDPLGSAEIPPAVDPTRRWLELARIIRAELADRSQAPPPDTAILRLAREMALTMDRLLAEGVSPQDLLSDAVLDQMGSLAAHWQDSIRLFARAQQHWLAWLEGQGLIDAATRRNLLFDRAAGQWRKNPPDMPIIAAGVTSAAPALARLLRTIADLPNGAVILPDLDLAMDQAAWDELGRAGRADSAGGEIFGRDDAVTHPQYHLKLLLNRMNIAREEVQHWHRKGTGAARPERSHAISSLFLPPEASKGWITLDAAKRRLSGITLLEAATSEEEAQSTALLIRQALDQPGKRVALVTPDRSLAQRVTQHLRRWNIAADDSAGRPLSMTPAGRLFLHLAQLAQDGFAPVPLIAALGHPLVHRDDGRAAWLAALREFELALRGPRPARGLGPLASIADRAGVGDWWDGVAPILADLQELRGLPGDDGRIGLGDLMDILAHTGGALAGDALWAREDGRALGRFVEDLRLHARAAGARVERRNIHGILRDAMDQIAVRPPYGSHPRVAIYGLLEARMTRADLVICAGLNEGGWPGVSGGDALLAPAILRALGVPGADFRIGLSAHDLAGLMGAPQVVLSRAMRDRDGPTIPSRFLLRVAALLGELAPLHRDQEIVQMAGQIDRPVAPAATYARPEPDPPAHLRQIDIKVTALDRLLGDPYQFYASEILKLRQLDPLDAEPTPAWQGTLVHKILESWHRAASDDPTAALIPIAERIIAQENLHPLLAGLWKPRLYAALEWVEQAIGQQAGRQVIAAERKGSMLVQGVRIYGRADRIDRLEDGTLAIIDYKTGKPPSPAQAEAGFALQLGLLGLIAGKGDFDGLTGQASIFEYWSLARNRDGGFGYIETPVRTGRKKSGLLPDEFLPAHEAFVAQAIDEYIRGNRPFTAKLNPDYPGYSDYDQLMRLEEWQFRLGDRARGPQG